MTTISWTSKVWNIVLGCTRDNEECDRCFAMHVAHRGLIEEHRGLTKLRPKGASRPGVDWNGVVRLVPERLLLPFSWRKPRKIFVNSMSDLFHPQVPFEFIAAAFGVMAATPQHTYQILTKRPQRAREFFLWLSSTVEVVKDGDGDVRYCLMQAFKHGVVWERHIDYPTWPLPNVHLGVSAGRQETASKIFDLLHCPAAVHWVSIEPMLGPVDLTQIECADQHGPTYVLDALRGEIHLPPTRGVFFAPNRLAWVVVGGESGAGARPCDLAWIRDVISQCKRADVPVFCKQVGARPIFFPGDPITGYEGIPQVWPTSDAKGETMTEWPEDLRVREWPKAV